MIAEEYWMNVGKYLMSMLMLTGMNSLQPSVKFDLLRLDHDFEHLGDVMQKGEDVAALLDVGALSEQFVRSLNTIYSGEDVAKNQFLILWYQFLTSLVGLELADIREKMAQDVWRSIQKQIKKHPGEDRAIFSLFIPKTLEDKGLSDPAYEVHKRTIQGLRAVFLFTVLSADRDRQIFDKPSSELDGPDTELVKLFKGLATSQKRNFMTRGLLELMQTSGNKQLQDMYQRLDVLWKRFGGSAKYVR